ncbi:MAG: hypothetical protein EOP92_16640 [Lysobacteraceae bacterium]|nr:MAG: hypothetical protein EOP92_16640 [Xanthomonadaceae bacterium]
MEPMMRLLSLLLVGAVLAGCAPAALKYSPSEVTPTMMMARYDRSLGRCSEGAIQLISAAEFDELARSWSTSDAVMQSGTCSSPSVESLPSRTDYPRDAAGKYPTGAAHVLVKVERDGSAHSAHTVCATSSAFAESAALTAKRLTYKTVGCNGKQARSVILVPLAFDPN